MQKRRYGHGAASANKHVSSPVPPSLREWGAFAEKMQPGSPRPRSLENGKALRMPYERGQWSRVPSRAKLSAASAFFAAPI